MTLYHVFAQTSRNTVVRFCRKMCRLDKTSSVAREWGAQASPINLKSMQNTLYLALFRAIFALKITIAPPNSIGNGSCQEPDVILSTKTGFQSG